MRNDKRIKRKVRRSYVVSTISISLVLFLLGGVGYMLSAALSTAHTLRSSITLSAELDNSISPERKREIEQQIGTFEGVEKVSYSPKEEKIEDAEFRRMFATELESILEENPLRNSFEVAISTREKAATDALVDKLSSIEGVVYVAYPASTIEQLHSTITKITIILAAFGGALLIISLILLNNTIRLAIFSRRYLINTLKLVGATKWYIMRPLLGSALKQGVWAGVISGLMIAFTVYGVEAFTPQGIAMLDHIAVGIIIGSTLSVGVVITLLYTAAAVNKFVNMKTNKIYLY